MRSTLILIILLTGAATLMAAVPEARQQATFKASASLVTVSVSVRDRHGKPVSGLTREDFEVSTDGASRAIAEFRSEATPVNIALLVDLSGSMRMSSRFTAAREAAGHLVTWLEPGRDHLAVFTFDTGLQEIQAFAPVSEDSLSGLILERPFGQTSLYDALAETGRRLVTMAGPRRAVVAITDGVDTSSALSAAEVSTRAAAIDVPAYIVAVVVPIDRPDTNKASAVPGSTLEHLANTTGGQFFIASTPSESSQAARHIVTELRQQYFIAFEPDARPGWHGLAIRTRNSEQVVRTRAGYVVKSRS